MEKIETMLESVNADLNEVKSNLLAEKAKVAGKNTEGDVTDYDLESEKAIEDANKSKVLVTNSQLTEEEIPKCVRDLHHKYNNQIDFDSLLSADDLAILSGASRQTVLNYANSGILNGQKKLGDKTVYFDFKESVVPLFCQLMSKRTQEDRTRNEINIVCLCKDEPEKDKYLQAIKSKYSSVVSNETLFELLYSSLSMPTDIVFTANKAIDFAEELYEKEKKDIDTDEVLKRTELDKDVADDYNERQIAFFRTLSKVDFSSDKYSVTAEDVKPILQEMARIQAIELATRKNISIKSSKNSKVMNVRRKYAYETEVGTEFEKMYVRALKIAIGNNLRKTLYKTLLSEHVMLSVCELSEDFAVNMMSIEETFRNIHPSYRTLVMGYSTLDDSMKAYIDAKCNSLKNLGSEYSVTTM